MTSYRISHKTYVMTELLLVLLLQVMVSSKLDDLQDQDHLGLFAKISQRVAFAKSHMLSISHSTGKTADSDSSISEVI